MMNMPIFVIGHKEKFDETLKNTNSVDNSYILFAKTVQEIMNSDVLDEYKIAAINICHIILTNRMTL